MHIALVDPIWSGHTFNYLSQMSRTFLAKGHTPVIFCANKHEMKVLLGKTYQEIAIIDYQWPREGSSTYSRRSARRTALARLLHLRSTLQGYETHTKSPLDFVFFPTLDRFLGNYQTRWEWNRAFRWPFSGVYHNLRHLYRANCTSFLRVGPLDRDDILRCRYCRTVAVFDNTLTQALRRKLRTPQIIVFPQFADTALDPSNPLLGHVLARSRGRRIIGLLGVISESKGVLDLVDAFSRLPADKYFLMLAGAVALDWFSPTAKARYKAFSASLPENVLLYPHAIPQESTFNSLIAACDVLWLAYRNTYTSSNVLTKAASFHVPVIATEGYPNGASVQRHGLGAVVPEGDIGAMEQLLLRDDLFLLKHDESFHLRSESYASTNSTQHLEKLCDAMLAFDPAS